MATDVNVQYFSHLNGLTLGNNWGDLIRLLDTCLVNGLPLTSITSATIDAQGDITLNLYAAHNCMLFQIIELSGFTPAELNGKYRIKGVPSVNQIILKAEHVGKSINTTGTAKLASLGYEIIFRDTNDVKRVYRAKNPTAQHPFIRVDETISDGVNSYSSAYAKSAMVGLIENMSHIDDYLDPNKLQLPLDTADPTSNWKITGTGTSVARGWSRWYWARNANAFTLSADSSAPATANRKFTLVGDKDAFYFLRQLQSSEGQKVLSGCGLYSESLLPDVIPNWFLMTTLTKNNAATGLNLVNLEGGNPLTTNVTASTFLAPEYSPTVKFINHTICRGIIQDYNTGWSNIFSGNSVGALEIPFTAPNTVLRGSLKHIYYAGNKLGYENTQPIISDKAMYIWDSTMVLSGIGGFYFYLGSLE
ncbi:hypothetical protein F7P73_15675 [Acinetobacter bohemicus]|uniref:Uncharacterized protein n=1 Tax=Acinetobacter bohemicus TaxID=1435036 RepID=A0A1I6W0C8_9GAMM|nr:hypothetical protein [Acinetobacter bohemicus]KAB0650726.1 hypothetical protein F7P73_15675 [Acinetobacter bohemicus]SFT19399.1 hypothetical protein SAMN05444586_10378 [Acinetobacter bohemicus]